MQLSVIIPVYNGASTLKSCLDSIVRQNSDFEILLINDGSKDDSLKICQEYASRFPFIRVVDKPNKGVCATRNLGIELAQGQWLMFIDQDDYIDDGCFERLLPDSDDVEYDAVIAPLIRHGRSGDITQCTITKTGIFTPYSKEFGECFKEYGFLGMGAPWSRIYRTSTVQKMTFKFNPEVTYCEDLSFNYLFWKEARAVRMISEPFYHYVNTFANTTAKFVGEQHIINNNYLLSIENPFWNSSRYGDEERKFLDEHRAFCTLFAIYTIYRTPFKMPKKERLYWLKRYYDFSDSFVEDQTQYYHLWWHKLFGRFMRTRQYRAADQLLTTVFGIESFVNRLRH